jgi:hypothetical protein
MHIHDDVISAIGNTPLIKLRRASELTGCTILGKAEFLNPRSTTGTPRASSSPRAPPSPRSSAGAASPPTSWTPPSTRSSSIPDTEALPVLFDLIEHEGLFLGGSSAVNVAGAIRLARKMGPGHTLVTMLCDSGNRYASKLFNAPFLRFKGLPVPRWLERDSDAPSASSLLSDVLLARTPAT